MSDAPTPITDAAIVKGYSFSELVPAKVARQLERELAEALGKIDAMTGSLDRISDAHVEATGELMESREQRDRLAEALRDIADDEPEPDTYANGYNAAYRARATARRALAAVEGGKP